MLYIKMLRLLRFLLIFVSFSEGFLLDNTNTSLLVKQTFLTVSEYYGDKSQQHREQEAYRTQLHNELQAYHSQQEAYHSQQVAYQGQQEAYRTEQDKALRLLADQLQQRLLAMEQKINENSNTSEVEKKYTAMTEKVEKWEQKYQELARNYTELSQLSETLQTQNQMCLKNNTKQQNEIDNLKATVNRTENKTSDTQHELEKLKHLKAINELQFLSNLASKVNTLDSRINLLSGHEQSRNQDFLALYSLTTATSSKLQQTEHQIRYNLTSRIDTLANITDSLTQSLNMSIKQLQNTVNENNEKVVLVACDDGRNGAPLYKSGSTYKFPTILTKVGLPELKTFTSTGKFMCPVRGIYHISAVLTTDGDNVGIYIMKNSANVHYQYITGYSHSGGYLTPGTAVIALELNINDTVWIKPNKDAHLYYSYLTIFKL